MNLRRRSRSLAASSPYVFEIGVELLNRLIVRNLINVEKFVPAVSPHTWKITGSVVRGF